MSYPSWLNSFFSSLEWSRFKSFHIICSFTIKYALDLPWKRILCTRTQFFCITGYSCETNHEDSSGFMPVREWSWWLWGNKSIVVGCWQFLHCCVAVLLFHLFNLVLGIWLFIPPNTSITHNNRNAYQYYNTKIP